MNFPTLKKILLRLYHAYVSKYFSKIIISLFLSFGVAGSTAAIAWLLDPAIKKMFIEQDKTMMLLIPFAIAFAFATKGLTLYFARTVLIKVGNEIVLTIGYFCRCNLLCINRFVALMLFFYFVEGCIIYY